MNVVCICGGCGRTIDKDFIYCPWCGRERIKLNGKENFDSVFDRLEEMQEANRNLQIERAQKKLCDLEKELNCLVTNTELHK